MIFVNPINAAAFGATQHGDMRRNVASGPVPLDRAEPNPNDVICARGKRAYNHPGNVRFRHLIETQMEAYKQAKSKIDKSLIVSLIIDGVRENDGGFIRQDEGQSLVEVGDIAAREKVGQCFRDLLHTKYKSSNKAKQVRKIKCLTSDNGDEQQHDSDAASASSSEADEPRPEMALSIDAHTEKRERTVLMLQNQSLESFEDLETK